MAISKKKREKRKSIAFGSLPNSPSFKYLEEKIPNFEL